MKCRGRRLACVSVMGNSSEGPSAPGVDQGPPDGKGNVVRSWGPCEDVTVFFFYLDRERRPSRLTAETCVLASSMEVQPVTACGQVMIGLEVRVGGRREEWKSSISSAVAQEGGGSYV